MEYWPTIGLEIHAELKTASKMFCGCKNDPDEKTPNKNVCPVCLAHPGTLPVINKQAVENVLRVGLAVDGKIAYDFTEFDRKNYFYPDIPKGYQISQYKFPLVSGGELAGVKLTRIHLEEDTARSQHDQKTGESLVDFNRAGVPLMELVTEPVITSAKQAGDFARELQLLLRYLGVSEANMEKGEMRVEANISVASAKPGKFSPLYPQAGSDADRNFAASPLGVKVEVKNLNSFRAVERAIAYELERQEAVLERGEKVVQETRGWDDAKGQTFSQRLKESSHDYRYFPEPDLPKLRLGKIPEFAEDKLRATLPELPGQKRERLDKLGFLQNQDIEQLVGDLELAKFFDQAAAELKDEKLVKIAANIILNDIAGKRKTELAWLPDQALFLSAIRSGLPMPQIRTSVLGGQLMEAADEAELSKIVAEVTAANPKVVEDFRSGKPAALQFLIGQGMKVSRGRANPETLRALLTDKLK